MHPKVDFFEDISPVTDAEAFDPLFDIGYTNRSARRDAKAKKAAEETSTPFSEEGFTRVGAARYLTMDNEASCDTIRQPVRTATKRFGRDSRSPYRAQPTRRACNAH